MFVAQPSAAGQRATVVRGEGAGQGSTSTSILLCVGGCELEREPLGGSNELWHLGARVDDCDAYVSFSAEGLSSRSAEVVLETSTMPELRTSEVT
ncbi:hypothetical protein G7066_14715 [Leucobacter coleopterorum]|uniref:Uncharacterized protein n=1 Tax=Leucobacter coleopterorum TaxID=2714933 RepID=A0ABX6K2W6_9MICO|nr:hypothetical protein [Leucobacter coleopterorum]QIM19515.1 hypothetical protein G7066_14715 [Leucobacter coleopterorum]